MLHAVAGSPPPLPPPLLSCSAPSPTPCLLCTILSSIHKEEDGSVA
uniref:Uncharacterized protein n=1 Tax=Arundo donax TaxID=35708 RepID=A0A0A9C1A7_ARUDO